MENQQRRTARRRIEQAIGELLLVIVIDRTVNVAALKLVFKATVNDQRLRESSAVSAIQDINHCFLRDSWQALIIGAEMRKL